MRDTWLGLVDYVLRPARPHLTRCLHERERHLRERHLADAERRRAIADCEHRIEMARARVFAANDGVVASEMTNLEREWRRLSRVDPEAGLMDLWARIAPPSWIDRKRWRDSSAAAQVDSAVALAADVEGVEAAEAAIDSLRTVLVPWGIEIGPRTRWRSRSSDAEPVTVLLAEPLATATGALSEPSALRVVCERAARLETDVFRAALARFPDRRMLACGLAHAAYTDFVWQAAPLHDRPNPVAPLRALWATGYVLSDVDASAVTLELPPL